MEERLAELWDIQAARAAILIVASVACAWIVEVVVRRTLVVFVGRTQTTFDDLVVAAIRRPLFLTALMIGLSYAAREIDISTDVHQILRSIIWTLGILVWTGATFRISHAVLDVLSRRASDTAIVQPRTMPVFEMLIKIVVVGAAIYTIFLAWEIDLTAWLASAGIVGIAVGFAAKDTLANLFAGIFIVADAPYKVGDFIVLDDELRGQVTKIGIRSTRVLTRDDVEITIPNAVIGASKIVNETGGPNPRQRVRIPVDVAYGSNVDKVREVMLSCPRGYADIAPEPTPEVRFREFGDSGLRFELLVWIDDPSIRGRVIDRLNEAIYKAFAQADVEIPFSKHDVYIKQMPTR